MLSRMAFCGGPLADVPVFRAGVVVHDPYGGLSKRRRSLFSVVLLLTISSRDVFFLLNLRGNATMADKPSDLVGGNSGHAHFENAGARTHAWIWDRRPARTDEQGRFPPECRFAVCRLSAARTSGADQQRMESHRE